VCDRPQISGDLMFKPSPTASLAALRSCCQMLPLALKFK
jgi:hypothetical protein